MMRQGGEDFRRRTRNVEEESDAVLVAKVAQRLGKRHQMIVVHPDQIIRREDVVQLTGEEVVDAQIAAQIATGEFCAVDLVVENRPQHAIGEAVVVFLVIFLGEVADDVSDLVARDRPGFDLGARRYASAPTEPNPRHALERRLDGDLEPAGTHPALIRNGYPVRYYDEPRQ